MIVARDGPKFLQKAGIGKGHEGEVSVDGFSKLAYLVAMLLALMGILIDVKIAERKTTPVIGMKPQSMLKQLCCIEVPEPYLAIPKNDCQGAAPSQASVAPNRSARRKIFVL